MYFKKFDTIYYPFTIGNQDVINAVTDVTTNVRFRKEIFENITLFDEYDIVDGETPEIIAAKVYGSSEYHWVIMLANQRYNYLTDFPMDSNTLNDYIKDKYGDSIYAVHHYVNSQGFVVNSDAEFATPVTNYDYEVSVNESKRRIKLISPRLLSQVVTQFNGLI